jgi:hypothetical protein
MPGAAPSADVAGYVKVARLISNIQRTAEQGWSLLRGGPYGEQIVQAVTNKQHGAGDEGSLFLTRTPTPGTGTASITAPTAYVATSPYIIVTNGNPAGGKNLWMDRIHLNLITPGTSSTDLQFTTALDAVARYTSGGIGGANTNVAAIMAGPYPTNSGAPIATNALVYAGALVAAAASNANRLLCTRSLRTAIAIAKDQYDITFGADQALDGILVSGAAIAQRSIPHPAVCIAPGGSFLFHLYGTAMAAATTCEVEIQHIER